MIKFFKACLETIDKKNELSFLSGMQVDNPKLLCASVAVGTAKKTGDADSLMDRVVNATYDLCRSNPGAGLIPTFPDFAPLLAKMSETQTRSEDPGYQVTVVNADGLIVKEPFFEQFGEGENEIAEFHAIIEDHNSKYNREGVRLARETTANPVESEGSGPMSCPLVESAEPLTMDKLASMDLSSPWQLFALPHPHLD